MKDAEWAYVMCFCTLWDFSFCLRVLPPLSAGFWRIFYGTWFPISIRPSLVICTVKLLLRVVSIRLLHSFAAFWNWSFLFPRFWHHSDSLICHFHDVCSMRILLIYSRVLGTLTFSFSVISKTSISKCAVRWYLVSAYFFWYLWSPFCILVMS